MSWKDLLFQGSNGLVYAAVVGFLAYETLVLSRVPGERTLVKLHGFDLVVTEDETLSALSAPLGPVGDRS